MDTPIRNIIFDMGKVLIRFEPDHFLDRAGIVNLEDRKLLKKEIYESPMWTQMDMGILDEEGMIDKVRPVLPEHLQKYTETLIAGWCEPIEMVVGMKDLIFELKEKGYGIFLLSNASRMQKEYWKQVDCSSCFDGTVVSAFEGVMKPDKKIYEILLERCHLKAEECLFIDDRKANVDTAVFLDMTGYVFDGDAERLRFFLQKHGIL